MKKNVYLVLFLSLILFFTIRPTSKPSKVVQQSKNQDMRGPLAKETTRMPASVPSKAPIQKKTVDVTKVLKREYRGDYKKNSPLKLINKVSDNWKDKFTKHFLGDIPQDKQAKNLEIKHQKSIVDVKQGIGRNLEHIIVSYTKPDGKPFSFEALVDSETGAMIQSWNQTRYEFKKPYKINMRGREFRSQK